MRNDNIRQTPDRNKGKQESSAIPRPAEPGRQTWEDGRREPIHPDDIGADGKYVGSDMPPEDVNPRKR